ncbi:MAG TPA: hypothetical protein GXZ32_00870 [Clostridiales bacterium]|nr:hypothetical protein [Clostridiales bacterium]
MTVIRRAVELLRKAAGIDSKFIGATIKHCIKPVYSMARLKCLNMQLWKTCWGLGKKQNKEVLKAYK